MRRRLTLALAVLGALAVAAPASAITRFDVLDVRVPGHLQPVLGSDGRQHLVYELVLRNLSSQHGLVVEHVEVRAAPGGRVVATLEGDGLTPDMNLGDPFSPAPATTLGPGQTGVVWMRPTFATRAQVPAALRHVVRVAPAPGTDRADYDSHFGTVVRTAPVAIDRRPPMVLGPPLRGAGYVAFNGCCASPGHVRTALSVEGQVRVAERFAIDWMQSNPEGELWRGDGTRNEQYHVYGRPILAVADGRVVTAVDEYEDTPPLQRSTDTVSPDLAAGNHLIVDFGHGRYGLYAHIKPGSVRVRAGQRIKRGDVLGLVGSSGNSDAPHLHFHLTDRPSPLAADGIPYVQDRFTLQGHATEDEIVWRDAPAARRDALPLDRTVVRFP